MKLDEEQNLAWKLNKFEESITYKHIWIPSPAPKTYSPEVPTMILKITPHTQKNPEKLQATTSLCCIYFQPSNLT